MDEYRYFISSELLGIIMLRIKLADIGLDPNLIYSGSSILVIIFRLVLGRNRKGINIESSPHRGVNSLYPIMHNYKSTSGTVY